MPTPLISWAVTEDWYDYVAVHEGKKTQSNMQAGGVLRDHAFKLYRGTIDFKWGLKVQ